MHHLIWTCPAGPCHRVSRFSQHCGGGGRTQPAVPDHPTPKEAQLSGDHAWCLHPRGGINRSTLKARITARVSIMCRTACQ